MISDTRIEWDVLVTMLTNKECLLHGMSELDTACFADEKSRGVFKAIQLCGEGVDPEMVRVKLGELKLYSSFGGDFWWAEFLKSNSYTYAFEGYCRKLFEYKQRRELLKLGEGIQKKANDFASPVEDITDTFETRLRDLYRKDATDMNTVSSYGYENIVVDEKFVRTGFREIDRVLTGFYEGQFVILGARPSQGKSALALRVAMNVAQDRPVLFYSLEMSLRELSLRMLAMESFCEINEIRRGKHKEQVLKALDRLKVNCTELYLNDSCYNLNRIVNSARRFHERKELGLIVVDYLQLISVKAQESRERQIAEITRTLKLLAMSTGVPVFAPAQLSRAPENRPNSEPRLSDLRESGAQEQDADIVLFIHTPNESRESVKQLSIAKNRNGNTGRIQLHFKKENVLFTDISVESQEFDNCIPLPTGVE